jgi:chaperonin cofactor prefoldin|tara:strand:+ start:1762 stop:2019 length:258 start_codon:yes stop_codon:yes gene_type:complete
MISDEEAKKMTEEWKDEIRVSGNVLPRNTDRGPSDLEEQIETLKFRNEVLHKANQKQMNEILELRAQIKKLEHNAVNQFRNKGDL